MTDPDPAWVRWLSLPARAGWPRVKAHRAAPLSPGGRCRLTLFEAVDGGRPHPRVRVSLPPAVDPSPPGPLFAPHPVPADAAAFRAAVEEALTTHAAVLAGADLDLDVVPETSRQFHRASIGGQRTAALFSEAASALAAHGAGWPEAERARARYHLAELRDLALVGAHAFDDQDTGTYHSFGNDKPFVHVLEEILLTVPEAGSPGFARLPPEQQQAVRAQRRQCTAHLDHLMRHKYALHGIDEQDIERSAGGRLIHRRTREVITAERDERSLTPRLVLLRVDPDSDHADAGAWVYQDGTRFRRRDGAEVRVEVRDLRRIPVAPEEVTLERHPDGPLLRQGVPFDWDRNGLLGRSPIAWVEWAGHCDLKAVQEALGLTLTGEDANLQVQEHRTDTGETWTFSRDRLLDILTALLEFGSVYHAFDGSKDRIRGQTRFGGARNDSLPDRLQLQGLGPGQHFRWPLDPQQDALTLLGLPGEEGEADDLFRRFFPDAEALTLEPNPRYLTTVEGDYNVIDVSGRRLLLEGHDHGFDPFTGAHRRDHRTFELDLAQTRGRSLLGVHLHDAARRELYRVWLDHAQPAVVAVLERWEEQEHGWAPRVLAERNVVVPLVNPLQATLSREMGSDDPGTLQALLEAALRRGEGIVADTDAEAPVWNGVVTHLDVEREAADPAARVERWRVDLQARFGAARLRWLVKRDVEGRPVAFAAVPSDDGEVPSPDFLWQDFPDVASKGRERGTWIVNRAMVQRSVVELRPDDTVPGGTYVHDEHVKNLAELLWCGLSGHAWTVVHGNKRYAFTREEDWSDAVAAATAAREALDGAGEPPVGSPG